MVRVAANRRQACERGIVNGARRLEGGKLRDEDEAYREKGSAHP